MTHFLRGISVPVIGVAAILIVTWYVIPHMPDSKPDLSISSSYDGETATAVVSSKKNQAETTPVPVVPAKPQLPHFGVFGGFGTIPEVMFYADDSPTVAAVAKLNYAGELCTVEVPPLRREGEFCFSRAFKTEPGANYTATLHSLVVDVPPHQD